MEGVYFRPVIIQFLLSFLWSPVYIIKLCFRVSNKNDVFTKLSLNNKSLLLIVMLNGVRHHYVAIMITETLVKCTSAETYFFLKYVNNIMLFCRTDFSNALADSKILQSHLKRV